jgi:hypothetical protein
MALCVLNRALTKSCVKTVPNFVSDFSRPTKRKEAEERKSWKRRKPRTSKNAAKRGSKIAM